LTMPHEPDRQPTLWTVERPSPRPSARAVEEASGPGVKRNDPLPSFLAAESCKGSGVWHRQLWTVFHGVRRHPGLTAAELNERLDLGDKYVCSRRLPELRDRFKCVCNGRSRRCTVSPGRRLSQTWYCSRRWIDKADGQQVSAPAQRPTAATTSEPAAPSAPAEGSAGHGRPGALSAVPSNVTTPEDRRLNRDRLRTSASPEVQRFLEGLKR